MPKAGQYSELEYLILAMIGEGRASGYAMRKEMTRMKGGRWSAESGSVYRVLKRLEALGLVEVAGKAGAKRRERTEYILTPAGHDLVDGWLRTPNESIELGYLVDTLRTRAYFLNRMDEAERVRIVKGWLAESKRFLEYVQEEVASRPFQHPIRDVAYANLEHLAAARVEWLRKLLHVVKEHPVPQTPFAPPLNGES